jgi:predicted dehydrogenase
MMPSNTSSPVGVALYGNNGHQIQQLLKAQPAARWVAAAAIDDIPEGVRAHPDLTSLLADPAVDLVVFCSPKRSEQGTHILRALEAGKHVYAEKPCTLDVATLDEIILTAKRTSCRFHEMADTAFIQPYATLREIVQSGVLGEVIQVFSQKSYPWADWRPGDESNDGGLARQVGVYNLRFAEHVAGLKTKSIDIRETQLGNEFPNHECHRAVSFLMEFENGAVGSAIANYACPTTWPKWGYDVLRIFGSKGFVEAMDHGSSGQLVIEGQPPQALEFSKPVPGFFDRFIDEILTGEAHIPITLEEELNPTRWVLRAKA